MDFKNKWLHIIKKTLTWIARRLPDCGSIWMLHDCAQGMTQATDEQYFVSVDAFERLIKKKLLDGNTFQSLNELENSNCKNIFVTFDDGLESVYRDALPILKKYSIPFCIFVITEKIGQSGYLSEVQLKELEQCHLCTLGAHTLSHCKLRECESGRSWKEIEYSKEELEKIVNHPIKYMAYPYGDIKSVSYRDIRFAKKGCYAMAFSTIQSHISKPFIKHKYFIPRLNVNNEFVTKQCGTNNCSLD